MKKALIVLAVLALLSGCALMANRVACTAAGDEAIFVSKYGSFGFAATIADADRAVICKR